MEQDEISQEKHENDIERVKIMTSVNKSKSELIRDLKGGLGTMIKANPSKIIIHKKSRFSKFMDGLKKFLKRI